MSQPRLPVPVHIEGIPVHPWTVDSLHRYIGECIAGGHRARIFNVNVHAMNLAHQLDDFRRQLLAAETIFCDGEGVRLAARILGQNLPPRITYADWLWELAEWGAGKGASFYFLGSEPGVAEEAARRLRQRQPGLRIVGVGDGFWRRREEADERVVTAVNAADPDILVVGLGMPFQELWLGGCWPRLNARIGLTGGACFDVISGRLSRCPRWMGDHGLHWLYRLGQEPRRLFKRYVIGNPWFFGRVLLTRLSPS